MAVTVGNPHDTVRHLLSVRRHARRMMQARGLWHLPNPHWPNENGDDDDDKELEKYLDLKKKLGTPVKIKKALSLRFSDRKPKPGGEGDDAATHVVYFQIHKCKIDVAYVRKLVARHPHLSIVLVADQRMTSFAKHELVSGGASGQRHQFFAFHELQFNLQAYVPRHRRLTTVELEAFCKRYYVRNPVTELPELQLRDPVSKYYHYDVNDVIEIERPTSNGDRCVYYRVVVDRPDQ